MKWGPLSGIDVAALAVYRLDLPQGYFVRPPNAQSSAATMNAQKGAIFEVLIPATSAFWTMAFLFWAQIGSRVTVSATIGVRRLPRVKLTKSERKQTFGHEGRLGVGKPSQSGPAFQAQC